MSIFFITGKNPLKFIDKLLYWSPSNTAALIDLNHFMCPVKV